LVRVNRASLSIKSRDLDAASITARIGIEPTRSPEARSDFDSARHSRWILHHYDEGSAEDRTGFASLRALLASLVPVNEALVALRDSGTCELVLWWTADSGSEQGSFLLPVDVIDGLALLGLDMNGTVNLSGEDER
jgi:hypothetical protein